MKKLVIMPSRAVNLLPFAKILFDENKTYSQAEVDALVKQKADASFQAGVAKAKGDTQLEADAQELKRLREAEATRLTNSELEGIMGELKKDDYKDFGIKGIARFAKEFQNNLKGKTGDELKQALNQIREQDAEAQELYFGATEVKASTTLVEAALGGKQEKPDVREHYTNSTIRKRKD